MTGIGKPVKPQARLRPATDRNPSTRPHVAAQFGRMYLSCVMTVALIVAQAPSWRSDRGLAPQSNPDSALRLSLRSRGLTPSTSGGRLARSVPPLRPRLRADRGLGARSSPEKFKSRRHNGNLSPRWQSPAPRPPSDCRSIAGAFAYEGFRLKPDPVH